MLMRLTHHEQAWSSTSNFLSQPPSRDVSLANTPVTVAHSLPLPVTGPLAQARRRYRPRDTLPSLSASSSEDPSRVVSRANSQDPLMIFDMEQSEEDQDQ